MRKDILYAAIIGLLTGLFLVPTFSNNNINLPSQNLILFVGLPVLCVIGMVIARTLGKFIKVIYQLAKFVLTGVFNASIDFGILNILISLTGASMGIQYTVFKSISFVIANINSYFWNRSWTFEGQGAGISQDYVKFLVISLGGLLINVGIATAVVNLIEPSAGIDAKQWANVGAIFGSIAGLAWNFLGYKFVVFTKNRLTT